MGIAAKLFGLNNRYSSFKTEIGHPSARQGDPFKKSEPRVGGATVGGTPHSTNKLPTPSVPPSCNSLGFTGRATEGPMATGETEEESEEDESAVEYVEDLESDDEDEIEEDMEDFEYLGDGQWGKLDGEDSDSSDDEDDSSDDDKGDNDKKNKKTSTQTQDDHRRHDGQRRTTRKADKQGKSSRGRWHGTTRNHAIHTSPRMEPFSMDTDILLPQLGESTSNGQIKPLDH